jgi:hypothetical protein
MLKFHVLVHGSCGKAVAALSVTFDVALTALESLPRMFIEPDGSFVWTGVELQRENWQVDGNLIDQGDVLAYVELKGCCPEAEFHALLKAFGWPAAEILFQMPERGIFLREPEFRRLAASNEGAR